MKPPDDFAQGVASQQAGQLDQARALYLKVLKAKPDHAGALHLLGVVSLARGETDYAITLLRQCVRIEPGFAEAHNGLGNACASGHKWDEAVAAYEQAVTLKPEFAEAHCNLGIAYSARGKLDEAIASYRRSLALNPALAEAYNNLGLSLQKKEAFDEAVAAFRQAIALKPASAEAHCNLGGALKARGELAEAEAACRQAIALRPAFPPAFNTLGGVLGAQCRLDESIAAYREALRIEPRYAEAHNNLGYALQAQNQLAPALASYRAALQIDPDYAQAHFNEGLALLLQGNFPEGWKKYEFRRQTDQLREKKRFSQPLWRGEQSLAGHSILLSAEQGLGDTLQFVRYAPLVAQRGATVYLEVQPALQPLLSGLPGVAHIYAKGEALPAFDFHCPLLSLPLAFGTEPSTIPRAVPYVQAPPDRVSHWKETLAGKDGFKVGVVWSGNPKHRNDRNRSIPFKTFALLFDIPGCRFFSLQKDLGPGDPALVATTASVTNLSEQLHDFADTGAVIANLDLVISVDTSVVHLAGALGARTWILLPFAPDWRWMLEREDSPWYPTARLFRQERPDDWVSVIRKVKAAVGELEHQ